MHLCHNFRDIAHTRESQQVGQRAALYTVRVKRAYKRDDKYRVFGDFDGAGSYLGDVLDGYLSAQGFVGVSNDNTKFVQCESSTLNGDDLETLLLHGQSGQVADIFDAAGNFRIHQDADDVHRVRCAALFRLHPDRGALGPRERAR